MNNMNQPNQGSFWSGTPGKWNQMSTLNKGQQGTLDQLNRANQGGTFQPAADYYRNLLSDNSADANAFAAPAMRQFKEQIIPDIAEQFAGMGAGGLSSSGFQNSAVNAGTDLSERLASMRAQLRQQGAQGLQNIGQQGLGQYQENVYTQGQPGFLQSLAGTAGQIGGAVGGNALINQLYKK